jgi:hypothetical protein
MSQKALHAARDPFAPPKYQRGPKSSHRPAPQAAAASRERGERGGQPSRRVGPIDVNAAPSKAVPCPTCGLPYRPAPGQRECARNHAELAAERERLNAQLDHELDLRELLS